MRRTIRRILLKMIDRIFPPHPDDVIDDFEDRHELLDICQREVIHKVKWEMKKDKDFWRKRGIG